MTSSLVFNGRTYAALKATETVDCNGRFVKARNGGVKLYKLTGELEAFIVNNEKQGTFVVSASINSEGKPFYMHSTTNQTSAWLGFVGSKLRARTDAILAMHFSDKEQKAYEATHESQEDAVCKPH